MPKPIVTVVGSFAVGMTLRAARMPVFGETLIGSDFDMGPGGKGSNQAVAAVRLGAESHFVGLIGADPLGDMAVSLYAAEGVGTEHLVRRKDLKTGVGFIMVNPEGKNGIILDMGANRHMDRAFVTRAEARIAAGDVVLAVLEVPVDAAWAALDLGRKHGVRTVLNPAPARALPEAMFQSVDYLLPNETELRTLLGLSPDDPTPTVELGRQLRQRHGTAVIVTRGENGAVLLDERGEHAFPAAVVDVVDTTGAGDAFTAAFAVALAEGETVDDAIRFANCHGALACTRLGVIPALAYRSETDALFAASGKPDVSRPGRPLD
ncbi:MAG: ribokinase [Verrucomicrobia bacterium]|nr:ribokinase [Verrucomicrobiota bacterium]